MPSKKTINFEIVTPERTILKTKIFQVTVPTQEGDITVLPEHTPLVSSLKTGVLEITKEDGNIEIMSVAGGFLEVLLDKVVVLADNADRAQEIDEKETEKARRRAEDILKNLRDDDKEMFAEVSAQLERELAKTKTIKRWRNVRKR
ncbi:MAG TPA: ATP synthase F1 subunit epsilon [Patescibacteria group bacterium]|nr:ATP synthase F1 subunit epsilon [Patescibacteria group bacterium]